MDPLTIDLNADLGEGFPNDAALLDRITSASISCGAHAGDRATILATLSAAKARGVIVGAHPGYADREGFGRREQAMMAQEIEGLIIEQVESLGKLAAEVGLALRHVKPHGALYNQAQHDNEKASGVVAALSRLGLPLLGQPGTILEAKAHAAGVPYLTEGFPDRRYRDDGRLVPRSEPNALLHNPAEMEAQVVRLVNQGVNTLCIHGDDPHALTNADNIRAILQRHGMILRSFVTDGEGPTAKTPRTPRPEREEKKRGRI